jgi:hypothetical protein
MTKVHVYYTRAHHLALLVARDLDLAVDRARGRALNGSPYRGLDRFVTGPDLAYVLEAAKAVTRVLECPRSSPWCCSPC